MPNWVTLPTLNELRFQENPVSLTKLQRWCRNDVLPARKIEREWWVDLDAFDMVQHGDLDPLALAVASRLN